LAFVDIAAPGFDAATYDTTVAELQAEIHGVMPDGSHLVGLAALRAAYAAVDLGWVLAPTALARLAPWFDAGYRWFARHRQPISRAAAPLIGLVRARRTAARMARCRAGACAVPAHHEGEGR
jgi:predicted DCC family thiol-disulfide oxidoreductase YuxK